MVKCCAVEWTINNKKDLNNKLKELIKNLFTTLLHITPHTIEELIYYFTIFYDTKSITILEGKCGEVLWSEIE